MARYRLRKDLPFIPKGTMSIFQPTSELFCFWSYNNAEMRGFTLDQIRNLPEWFEKVEERWKPELGKDYFYIDCFGIVLKGYLTNSIEDEARFEIGNMFKTYENAGTASCRIKETLRKYHEEIQA